MATRSVFDVPRKPQQLKSANEGVANAHYRQVSATKDVSGNQFSQGLQQFRFDTSANTWFLPSMCYFRLRCTLNQVREHAGNPLPILSSADIAPNMGLAANLFKSVELQLNGHTVERISERLLQIDALKTRLNNTHGWLQNLGKTRISGMQALPIDASTSLLTDTKTPPARCFRCMDQLFRKHMQALMQTT